MKLFTSSDWLVSKLKIELITQYINMQYLSIVMICRIKYTGMVIFASCTGGECITNIDP